MRAHELHGFHFPHFRRYVAHVTRRLRDWREIVIRFVPAVGRQKFVARHLHISAGTIAFERCIGYPVTVGIVVPVVFEKLIPVHPNLIACCCYLGWAGGLGVSRRRYCNQRSAEDQVLKTSAFDHKTPMDKLKKRKAEDTCWHGARLCDSVLTSNFSKVERHLLLQSLKAYSLLGRAGKCSVGLVALGRVEGGLVEPAFSGPVVTVGFTSVPAAAYRLPLGSAEHWVANLIM